MTVYTLTNRTMMALGFWDKDMVYRVVAGHGGVMSIEPSEAAQKLITLHRAIGAVDAVAEDGPVNTREPSISGTAAVGETLTLDPGAWVGASGVTQQWMLSGLPVEDETGLTFVVPSDSSGEWVTVLVTAVGEDGDTVLETDQYGPVA